MWTIFGNSFISLGQFYSLGHTLNTLLDKKGSTQDSNLDPRDWTLRCASHYTTLPIYLLPNPISFQPAFKFTVNHYDWICIKAQLKPNQQIKVLEDQYFSKCIRQAEGKKDKKIKNFDSQQLTNKSNFQNQVCCFQNEIDSKQLGCATYVTYVQMPMKLYTTINPGKVILIQKLFEMNLKTLGDFKKEDKNADKKKTTTSYTGGQSSGMAVVNPDVAGIMQKAEKNSKTPEQFAKEEKEKDGHVCKITLYENGFVVDGGEFRDYNEQRNKDFMKELNQGYVPKELRKIYPNGNVSVSLSDKTEQKYVPPPPPAYVEFSGHGVSLSGPVVPKESKFVKKRKACENFILQPDKTKQVTTIRVRLSNGTAVAMQVNLDSSLQDVHRHVSTVSGISTFELIGGYPPKPLDLDSTIQANDLAGATIIQK